MLIEIEIFLPAYKVVVLVTYQAWLDLIALNFLYRYMHLERGNTLTIVCRPRLTIAVQSFQIDRHTNVSSYYRDFKFMTWWKIWSY